jgi:hypothetical protein
MIIGCKNFCTFANTSSLNKPLKHKLNMELDLRSLFGLYVHCCTHWLRPRNPPPLPPALGLIYEGAISQPRQTTSLCEPLPRRLYLRMSRGFRLLSCASRFLETQLMTEKVREVGHLGAQFSFFRKGCARTHYFACAIIIILYCNLRSCLVGADRDLPPAVPPLTADHRQRGRGKQLRTWSLYYRKTVTQKNVKRKKIKVKSSKTIALFIIVLFLN